MKLTEMKQILESGGIILTKSLGQNFLHDGNQLRRIVEAAKLTKADKVLEIGPGLGPLTELLLEKAGEVFAIEKDRRLVEFLKERFSSKFEVQGSKSSVKGRVTDNTKGLKKIDAGPLTPTLSPGGGEGEDKVVSGLAAHQDPAIDLSVSKFELLHDDALEYLKREERDWSEWKLVANLPYSVASPILVELAQARGCPERMVVTLQLEVGERLVAQAGEDDYGVLSLLMQLRYKPAGHFKIPADCFFPAPDVDSACVALERRAEPLLPVELHQTFERIVKLGFSQRRKMMLKLLKMEWPAEKLTAAFEQLGLSPQIRAEKVSLEQFVELTGLLLK